MRNTRQQHVRETLVFATATLLTVFFSWHAAVVSRSAAYPFERFKNWAFAFELFVVSLSLLWVFRHDDLRETFAHRVHRATRSKFAITFWAMLLTMTTCCLFVQPANPFARVYATLCALSGGTMLAVSIWVLAVAKPKRLLLGLAVTVCCLGFGFAGLECVFRCCLVDYCVPRTDRDFHDRIVSSWPRSITPGRAAGTIRILGLSDSFGRAGGHSNYHYLLEQQLLAKGVRTEVINLSAGGFQPSDELLMLQRFGPRYQPDIVLHGLYVGNDLALETGELVSCAGISMPRPTGPASLLPHNLLLVKWLYRYSTALFAQQHNPPPDSEVTRPSTAVERKSNDTPDATADSPEMSGTFRTNVFLRLKRMHLERFRRTPSPTQRWDHVVALLDSIRAVTEQMGARYVLVIHPDELQVDTDLLALVHENSAVSASEYDMLLPQQFLKAYAKRTATPCLDLLPVLRTASSRTAVYLPQNTHYNQTGNNLAADSIADFLRAQDLLPNQNATVSADVHNIAPAAVRSGAVD